MSAPYVRGRLAAIQATIERIQADDRLLASIEEAGRLCHLALTQGHKLLFAGNGGSAADAQHIAAEFVSRFAFDRPGLAAMALTTDTSILTAVGNDYGFDQLFRRQLQALARPGDVLIAYSTSGTSRNIVEALEEAGRLGVRRIGMTGASGGQMQTRCEVLLQVPAAETPVIQEAHLIFGHTICGFVEQQMFPR